jgi:UDP-3-O-[3-hydroxymyristoyl] glucosamine N-acyltransferase
MFRGQKYNLTEESVEFNGHTLRRVEYTPEFKEYYKRTHRESVDLNKGGFIEHPYNLRQDDDALILDNAKVFEESRVRDQAIVKDEAVIGGLAGVFGSAGVRGNSHIDGMATISGHADISGTAQVTEKATVSDRGKVGDGCRVSGAVSVDDHASVKGNVSVGGLATITGDAKVIGDETGMTIDGMAYIGGSAKVKGGEGMHIGGDVRLYGCVRVEDISLVGKEEFCVGKITTESLEKETEKNETVLKKADSFACKEAGTHHGHLNGLPERGPMSIGGRS